MNYETTASRVVLLIIVVATAVGVYFWRLETTRQRHSDPIFVTTAEIKTANQITTLHGLLEAYRALHGVYPSRVRDVRTDPDLAASWDLAAEMLDARPLDQDVWGGQIRYRLQSDPQRPFGLRSLGPDAAPDTDDDITNTFWMENGEIGE